MQSFDLLPSPASGQRRSQDVDEHHHAAEEDLQPSLHVPAHRGEHELSMTQYFSPNCRNRAGLDDIERKAYGRDDRYMDNYDNLFL